MYEIIDTLNESLGKLNSGTNEFKEVVKALLQQKKITAVSPNSNIVNFTVSDIGEAPKKVMQIASTSDEVPAAIYLANAEGKGVILFSEDSATFDEKITKTTPVGVVSRNNGPWSKNGFRVQSQLALGNGRYKQMRFRDVAEFDMKGSISGAVIFQDPDVMKLRDDRLYTSTRNNDPLALSDHERNWNRNKRLEVYKASKGGDYTRGEITFKELSSIIQSGYNKSGIVFEGTLVKVVIYRSVVPPKNLESDPFINFATLEALEYDEEKNVKRHDILARLGVNVRTGKWTLTPRF